MKFEDLPDSARSTAEECLKMLLVYSHQQLDGEPAKELAQSVKEAFIELYLA